MPNVNKLKIAFFGGEPLSIPVLEELALKEIVPTLVVCNPDRPQGRELEVTPPPIKMWALQNSIATFQPESLKERETLSELTSQDWDLFVVVAYSQIMPKWLIELPKFGTVNLHPSLLPKLRGASPIRTGILEGLQDIGVTIMLMDEKLDHGPILDQQAVPLSFPIKGRELDATLAKVGGRLLADVIPRWTAGEITPKEQNHENATFSKKITKEMGELKIDPFNLPSGKEAYETYLKICAFDGWPSTFFFYNNKRIKITEAFLSDTGEQKLEIARVIPEGKKEMAFETFLNRSS